MAIGFVAFIGSLVPLSGGLHFAATIAGIVLMTMFVIAVISRCPWQD